MVAPLRRSRLRRSPLRLTPLGVVAVLAVAGCGSDATPNAAADDPSRPTVLATTTIWADVVRNVGCDDAVAVDTIMPAGADPHSYEPSLRDRERMGDAAVIVSNGRDLEESLLDTLGAVEDDGVTVVRVADALAAPSEDGSSATDTQDDDHTDDADHGDDEHTDDEHTDDEHTDDEHTDDEHTDDEHADDEHADDEHDDDEHDAGGHDHDHGVDPHVWFDPTQVAATLPEIADALVAAGADPDAIDECVVTYTAALEELDADIAALVEPLPTDDRLLVTNHDSIGYFADRYGFEVLGAVIPSPSSLVATNPSDLEALAQRIEATGVPAIFAETQHSSADTRALADRVGDVEVVTLQTDTLGEPDSDTATYVDWLRVTAGQIVDALTTS